jgi:hypothetical protein
MADEPLRSKPEGGAPFVPSRAKGSRKEEGVGPGRRARGRLKLKPEAEAEERFEPPRGKGPLKPEGRGPHPLSRGRKKVKPADSKRTATKRPSGRADRQDELPDQIARRRRGAGEGERPDGYVRFRVRVDEGKMSIVDSHLVDSVLMLPPTIHGEYAYEVTDGVRLLHADTIPDLGVVRSFSDPHGTRGQLRHHTYRETTYEFDVRAPAAELTQAALPNIEIVLYRTKERAPTRALTAAAPLGAQFERELRQVARIAGIPRDALPSVLRGRPRR